MKRQTKLTSQQQEQQQTAGQQAQQQSVSEFATPEELLRHDALHTPVPPSIAHRLKESVGQIPAPSRSWWRRFLGS
jgi:hypothetical protein